MSDPQKPPVDRAQRAIIIGFILVFFFAGNAIYGLIASFGVEVPGVQWFKSQPLYLAVSWFGCGLGLGALFCGVTLRAKPSPLKEPT
jgi:hypothetical protein